MQQDSLTALLAAAWRRRFSVLLVVAGAVVAAWWGMTAMPARFEARATLFVPGELPRPTLTGGGQDLPDSPVAPDLNETTRVGVIGLVSSPAVLQRAAEAVDGLSSEEFPRHVVADLDADQQLVVVAWHQDPVTAVAIANALVRALRSTMSEMAERTPRAMLAVLEKEEPQAWQAVADTRQLRLQRLLAFSSPDPATDLAMLASERQRLSQEMTNLAVLANQIRAQRPILEEALAGRPEHQWASRILVENPVWREALAKVAELRAEVAVARVSFAARHPSRLALEQRLALAEEQAQNEGARPQVESSLEERPDARAEAWIQQLVGLAVSESGIAPARAHLEARLQEIDQTLATLPGVQADLARLDAEITRLEGHATRVSSRIEELRLQLQQGFDFLWLDQAHMASADRVKEVPARAPTLIAAGLSGLAVGLALAVLMELFAVRRRRHPW